MHGLLRSLKTGEMPNYTGNVMKGMVTGLGRNNIGLYLFDIACVRGASHSFIPAYTGMSEREVHLISKDGQNHGAINIRFESVIGAGEADPLQIEIQAYDRLPDRRRLIAVTDALWQVINQSLAIDAEYMLATVRVDEEFQPQLRWARSHDAHGLIAPTSVSALMEHIHGTAE